jgi:hypothetical protein
MINQCGFGLLIEPIVTDGADGFDPSKPPKRPDDDIKKLGETFDLPADASIKQPLALQKRNREIISQTMALENRYEERVKKHTDLLKFQPNQEGHCPRHQFGPPRRRQGHSRP